jgi:hypothetical protein
MLKVCPNQPLCETRWTALRSHYRDDVSNPASQQFFHSDSQATEGPANYLFGWRS